MDSIMKERPILFNAAMVKAILAGNKTQTRRVMKTQIVFGDVIEGFPPLWHLPTGPESGILYPNGKDQIHAMCPLGKVGDRLWVREAWATDDSLDNKPPRDFSAWPVRYLADGKKRSCGAFTGNTAGKNRRSMHMPRWASRITLEITAVRVERLQDISEEDALAEGARTEQEAASEGASWYDKPCRAFQFLWQSIYGAESWEASPWVWIIEFKRITP
jgi:hypothetical protein